MVARKERASDERMFSAPLGMGEVMWTPVGRDILGVKFSYMLLCASWNQ